VAEDLNDNSYMGFGLCVHDLTMGHVEMIIRAFQKVWGQIESLK
jgi:hypothetical protein